MTQRVRRMSLLAAALSPLALLMAGCTGIMPSGEFDITYGPTPPEDIKASDSMAPSGVVRVSKALLETQPSGRMPGWKVSVEAEGAAATSKDEQHFGAYDGTVVIGETRIDAPFNLGVKWTLRDMDLSVVGSGDFGALWRFGCPFEIALGLGVSRTDVDVRYALDDGRVLTENYAATSFEFLLDLALRPTAWLALAVRMDYRTRLAIATFDGIVIVSPWRPVGFIAGWRVWTFYDEDTGGSNVDLTTSGPVLGLELRF